MTQTLNPDSSVSTVPRGVDSQGAGLNNTLRGDSQAGALYNSFTAQPTGADPLAITPTTRSNAQRSGIPTAQRTESANNNIIAANYLRSRQPTPSPSLPDQTYYRDQNIIHNAQTAQNQQRQSIGNQAFTNRQNAMLPDPTITNGAAGPTPSGKPLSTPGVILPDHGQSAPGDNSLVDRGDNSLLPGMGILKGKQLDALGAQLGVPRGTSSLNGKTQAMEDGVYADILRQKVMESPEFQKQVAADPKYAALTGQITDATNAQQRGMTLPDYQDAQQAQQALAKPDAKQNQTPEQNELDTINSIPDPEKRAKATDAYMKRQAAAKAEQDKTDLGNTKLTTQKQISEARIKYQYAVNDQKSKAVTAKIATTLVGINAKSQTAAAALTEKQLEYFGNQAAKAKASGAKDTELREMAENNWVRVENGMRKTMAAGGAKPEDIDAAVTKMRGQWEARNPGIYKVDQTGAGTDASAAQPQAAPATAPAPSAPAAQPQAAPAPAVAQATPATQPQASANPSPGAAPQFDPAKFSQNADGTFSHPGAPGARYQKVPGGYKRVG